jgi:hypothetical protein
MRYWISDKDTTPQRFPLQRLLRRVYEVTGTARETCDLHRARGYGERIRTLEERLDSEDVVTIAFAALDELSQGTEEWFYDLDAQIPGMDVRFGLHDSAALFVEAAPAIVDQVVSAFDSFRPAQSK